MKNRIIRYKDRKCFFSSDNWKNFEVLVNHTVDAEEEKRADIVTHVKFWYELGKAKSDIIINELNKIRELFDMPKGDGFGHAFEIFSAAVLHNLDYNTVYSKYIVNGKEDGKTDIVYWNEHEVILYQIKLDMLESSIKKQIKDNYLEFLETGTLTGENTSDLLKFYKKNRSNLTRNKNFKIYTVSTNLSSNNYTPVDVCKKFFEQQIICKDNNLVLTLNVPKIRTSTNELVNSISISKNGGYTFYTSAKSFVEELLSCTGVLKSENLYKYFYDNVRGNLGINKNMLSTITNEPKNFVKFNNGITITGSVSYKDTVGTLIIENPIISNGQQTVWNLVSKYPELDDVEISVTVNDCDFKIKSKIARYTNEQKSIKPIDLLSLDQKIRNLYYTIYKLCENSSDVFLELNSSGEKNYTKMVKKIYTKYGIISLNDFCKLYFSTQDLKLGNWKSNISNMIDELLNKDVTYDSEKALLVCNIIKKYKIYVDNIDDKKERNNLKVADLAFMFIMYTYNFDEESAHKIIKRINNKYYFNIPDKEKKSKLIDLYKSNDIYVKINNVIEENKYNSINV